MELEAIRVYQEAKKGGEIHAKPKEVRNNAYFQEHRSISTLMDILKLKQKYAKTEERKKRGEYQKEKRAHRQTFETLGKSRGFTSH